MKPQSFLLILFTLFTLNGFSQFTFSLGTGMQQNSAAFGYKYKNFVPQIGLQVMRASASINATGFENDSVGDIVAYDQSIMLSGAVFIPSVGVKYFFLNRDKLKAYGLLSVNKVILSAKIEDKDDPNADKELQKQLDNISISGGQLAFGTEYFFDSHFSIGGEFGFRSMRLNYKNNTTDNVFNPNTGDYEDLPATQTLKLNFMPTYSKFSINFYFGK
jgi:hypothetical protein